MFIVTLENKPEGVFSVYDDSDNRVVPIFQDEDDAERYLSMLDDDSAYPCLLYTSPSPRD